MSEESDRKLVREQISFLAEKLRDEYVAQSLEGQADILDAIENNCASNLLENVGFYAFFDKYPERKNDELFRYLLREFFLAKIEKIAIFRGE